ncbi:MAG: hypothetical protein MOB07_28060 [Acidobacteria bacterium]|nr:hypothetical protein [Acidobacteriota bacterium]
MSILKRLFGMSDDDALTAEPILRDRMDLLWLDDGGLQVLRSGLGSGDGVFIPDDEGGVRELRVSADDLEWAERVKAIAKKASAASAREDYPEAIKFYLEALKLAPGCDLYLMSIGCCYGNMGEVRKGHPWLQRAAEISPHNARIQRNLALQKELLAKGSQ